MKTTELHPYNITELDQDKYDWVFSNLDLLEEESGYQDITDTYTSL